ncbi:MAG: hypothetical protein ACLFNU_11790 [Bacteroidales bacterium]
MKKITFVLPIVLSFLISSCGSSDESKKSSDQQKNKTEKVKEEKKGLTIESYSALVNEQRALLMEKYWEDFKGKDYEEVKDLYEEYKKEEEAIHKKYGIEDILDISNFFRGHMKDVMEYQKNNPDFKDYPEYDEARRKLIAFAEKELSESM